ncbi:acyl-CoA dehydrogenase family protein [Pantoea sp. DY-15]|uniref:acyl-CoA dehydrogenase family protein n=1 Tax=Pantoea sp. DY-15 TaxID=2871489 RepID=UPI001C94C78B|nr:acyl-CoA dehydrogenase family protein [Pantoea sp. DY-15]MBY4890559.1 acyl-CoA dehydrogenase family protein [Pantoea sp. DY-15]
MCALSLSARSNPPTDKELLDVFRPVFKRIAENAIQREIDGRRPLEEVKWLRESGFTAVRVPREYGGLGASLRQLHLLLIELAAADSNLSHALRVQFRFIEGHLKQRDTPWSSGWLKKIASGVVIAAGSAERTGQHGKPSTRVTELDGKFYVNGGKYYSTGSIYADYLSVTATTDQDEVVTVLVPVNAPGVEVIDDWVGFGQKSSGSGTAIFTNTLVDKENIMPPARGTGGHYAHVQLSHLATTAGIVRRATDEISEFVATRHRTYNQASAQVPADDPLVQSVIGRADAAAYSLKALVLQVAGQLDELADARYAQHLGDTSLTQQEIDQLERDAGLDTYRAQTVVFDVALRVTNEIFEVGGASAIDQRRHLDRHWRNVRTLASHNPLIYRHRQLGEYRLKGTSPFDKKDKSKNLASEDAGLGV